MSDRGPTRWIRRLLPRELREEYGGDFVALFEERLAEEENNGGRGAAFRYWLHGVVDTLRTAYRVNLRKVWPETSGEARHAEPGSAGFGDPGAGLPGAGAAGSGRWRVSSWLDSLRQDLRYGWRQLRRNPGFTVVAVLTLAVGIGGNAAVFNLANVALLKPLAVDNAEDLVFVFAERPNRAAPSSRRFGGLVYAAYEEIERHNRVFEDVAAGGGGLNVAIGENLDDERVEPHWVSANYFGVLGVRPRLGRGLTQEDAEGTAPATAVISSRLWQSRFGADPAVLGTTILINQHPFTVVGVAPPEFNGLAPPEQVDVWFLARWWPQVYRNIYGPDFDWASGISFAVFGHLRDGIAHGPAAAETRAIVAAGFPGWREENGILISSTATGPGARAQWTRYALYALGTSILVLMVAWVNTAGLMMARTLARDREIGIRVALGCGRSRLLRQLSTEGLLLALLAGLISLAAANGLARLVLSVAPLPEFIPTVDSSVAAFTLVTVAVTAVALSLLPAARAWKTRRPHFGSGSGVRYLGSMRTQGMLIAAQVAVTVCLLVVAGLFVRTYQSVANTDLGFETEHVVTLALNPATQGYDAARTAVLRGQLADRISALPGVEIATPGGSPHFSGWSVPAVAEDAERHEDEVRITTAGPGWFEALGIPIIRGHGFEDVDERGAFEVAVVAEEAARRFWPGQDPIDKELTISAFRNAGLARDRTVRVIGVAADTVAADGLNFRTSLRLTLAAGAAVAPRVYIPDSSADGYATRIDVVVRTSGPAASLLPAIRAEVQELDETLSMRAGTLAEAMGQTMRDERTYAGFTSAFSGTAIVLALVGVFALMAHAVARGKRAFGVRMALGAVPGDIIKLVLRQGLTPVLAGIALGIAVAMAFSRLLESLLYGVGPIDPLTYGVTAVFVIVTAAVAGLIPAYRATRVDPCTTLRVE